MSVSSGHWEFSYKDPEINVMSEDDLDQYQLKLLEIREKFKDKVRNWILFPKIRISSWWSFVFKVAELGSSCEFFPETCHLPPEDNIFARFGCECKRHTPACSGWYLLWNPNVDQNRDKLKSSLHNRCATWQYKSTCKRIQQEILKLFEKYFHFFDDDDTHEYYIDSYYDLKYGFKQEDDEVPLYASSTVEEPVTYLHSLSSSHPTNSTAAHPTGHAHRQPSPHPGHSLWINFINSYLSSNQSI